MNPVILRPDRLRQLPEQFSWLDQRLARQRYFEHAAPESWLLYLFLVTVANAQGVSYYAERSLCQRLRLSREQLVAARRPLLALELIAYRQPLYQVLALEPAGRPIARARPSVPSPPLEQHLQSLYQALNPTGGRR